jgi:hypothetical protein
MFQRNRFQLNLALNVISGCKSETSGHANLLTISSAAADDGVLLDESDEKVVEQDGDGRKGNDGGNLEHIYVPLSDLKNLQNIMPDDFLTEASLYNGFYQTFSTFSTLSHTFSTFSTFFIL